MLKDRIRNVGNSQFYNLIMNALALLGREDKELPENFRKLLNHSRRAIEYFLSQADPQHISDAQKELAKKAMAMLNKSTESPSSPSFSPPQCVKAFLPAFEKQTARALNGTAHSNFTPPSLPSQFLKRSGSRRPS